MAAAKKAAPRAAKTTAKPAEDTFENNAEASFAFADAARDGYDSFLKAFNDNAEEFAGKSQEFVDAARASFETAQARLRDVAEEAAETARTDIAEAVDFANDLAKAKTIGDALELQRDYWTRFFDTRIERTRTMTQAAFDMTKEALEPVSKTSGAPFAQVFQMPAGFEKFFPFSAK